MNVTHLLLNQATVRPDAEAIVENVGGRRCAISYASLADQSARAAAVLVADGVRAGDPVLVFVPMSIDLYVALVAIFRIGAVATFLDPSAGRLHIERCCDSLPPAAMIAIPKAHLLRLTSGALRRIPVQYSVGRWLPFTRRWQRHQSFAARSQIEPTPGDSAALVTFTSGSTGRPKAAVRSHAFLAAQHAALAESIELAPGQIDLATLPIFTLANLASGVTSVIPDADLRRPGQIEPAPVLRQAQAERVTRAVASPAFFERLLTAGPHAAWGGFDRLHTGGAPVFPRLLERLQAAAPSADVVAVYGSTEAEPIAHIAVRELSATDSQDMRSGRGLLAGPPVAKIELRVIRADWGTPLGTFTRDEFAAIFCPTDEPGEIVVTGPHVLRGYLNGYGDDETKFRVGDAVWHRTGDLGFLDATGRLWLLGRAAAKIVDDRGTVYPLAVETVVNTCPGVVRCAIVGLDGKRLLAVEYEPATAESTMAEVADRVRGMAIDGICRLNRLPVDKRHNAKVDYWELMKVLRQRSKM